MPSDPSPDEGFWVLVARDGTRWGTHRFTSPYAAWAEVSVIQESLESKHPLESPAYALLDGPVVARIVHGVPVLEPNPDDSIL